MELHFTHLMLICGRLFAFEEAAFPFGFCSLETGLGVI